MIKKPSTTSSIYNWWFRIETTLEQELLIVQHFWRFVNFLNTPSSLDNFFTYRKSFLCYWLVPFIGFVSLTLINKENNVWFQNPMITQKNNEKKLNSILESGYFNKVNTSLNSIENVISWETLEYLNYKKLLLDSSEKYIYRIDDYYDHLILQTKPTWLERQKEHYLAFYQDLEIKKNLIKNTTLTEQSLENLCEFYLKEAQQLIYKPKQNLPFVEKNWQNLSESILANVLFSTSKIETYWHTINSKNTQKVTFIPTIWSYSNQLLAQQYNSNQNNHYLYSDFLHFLRVLRTYSHFAKIWTKEDCYLPIFSNMNKKNKTLLANQIKNKNLKKNKLENEWLELDEFPQKYFQHIDFLTLNKTINPLLIESEQKKKILKTPEFIFKQNIKLISEFQILNTNKKLTNFKEQFKIANTDILIQKMWLSLYNDLYEKSNLTKKFLLYKTKLDTIHNLEKNITILNLKNKKFDLNQQPIYSFQQATFLLDTLIKKCCFELGLQFLPQNLQNLKYNHLPIISEININKNPKKLTSNLTKILTLKILLKNIKVNFKKPTICLKKVQNNSVFLNYLNQLLNGVDILDFNHIKSNTNKTNTIFLPKKSDKKLFGFVNVKSNTFKQNLKLTSHNLNIKNKLTKSLPTTLVKKWNNIEFHTLTDILFFLFQNKYLNTIYQNNTFDKQNITEIAQKNNRQKLFVKNVLFKNYLDKIFVAKFLKIAPNKIQQKNMDFTNNKLKNKEQTSNTIMNKKVNLSNTNSIKNIKFLLCQTKNLNQTFYLLKSICSLNKYLKTQNIQFKLANKTLLNRNIKTNHFVKKNSSIKNKLTKNIDELFILRKLKNHLFINDVLKNLKQQEPSVVLTTMLISQKKPKLIQCEKINLKFNNSELNAPIIKKNLNKQYITKLIQDFDTKTITKNSFNKIVFHSSFPGKIFKYQNPFIMSGFVLPEFTLADVLKWKKIKSNLNTNNPNNCYIIPKPPNFVLPNKLNNNSNKTNKITKSRIKPIFMDQINLNNNFLQFKKITNDFICEKNKKINFWRHTNKLKLSLHQLRLARLLNILSLNLTNNDIKQNQYSGDSLTPIITNNDLKYFLNTNLKSFSNFSVIGFDGFKLLKYNKMFKIPNTSNDLNSFVFYEVKNNKELNNFVQDSKLKSLIPTHTKNIFLYYKKQTLLNSLVKLKNQQFKKVFCFTNQKFNKLNKVNLKQFKHHFTDSFSNKLKKDSKQKLIKKNHKYIKDNNLLDEKLKNNFVLYLDEMITYMFLKNKTNLKLDLENKNLFKTNIRIQVPILSQLKNQGYFEETMNKFIFDKFINNDFNVPLKSSMSQNRFLVNYKSLNLKLNMNPLVLDNKKIFSSSSWNYNSKINAFLYNQYYSPSFWQKQTNLKNNKIKTKFYIKKPVQNQKTVIKNLNSFNYIKRITDDFNGTLKSSRVLIFKESWLNKNSNLLNHFMNYIDFIRLKSIKILKQKKSKCLDEKIKNINTLETPESLKLFIKKTKSTNLQKLNNFYAKKSNKKNNIQKELKNKITNIKQIPVLLTLTKNKLKQKSNSINILFKPKRQNLKKIFTKTYSINNFEKRKMEKLFRTYLSCKYNSNLKTTDYTNTMQTSLTSVKLNKLKNNRNIRENILTRIKNRMKSNLIFNKLNPFINDYRLIYNYTNQNNVNYLTKSPEFFVNKKGRINKKSNFTSSLQIKQQNKFINSSNLLKKIHFIFLNKSKILKYSKKPDNIFNEINSKTALQIVNGVLQPVNHVNTFTDELSSKKIINDVSFVTLLKKKQHGQITLQRLQQQKKIQKERRMTKLKRETRYRKKRKRFFPRPIWSRFRMYKKYLKLRHKPQKNLNFVYNQKVREVKKEYTNFEKLASVSEINKNKIPIIKTPVRANLLNIKIQNRILRKKIYRNNKQKWGNCILDTPNFEKLTIQKSPFLKTLPKLASHKYYQISNTIMNDFKRVLWKSYWLRSHFNPYIKRVENHLNKIKNKNKSNFFVTLRSLVSYLLGFNIFENGFNQYWFTSCFHNSGSPFSITRKKLNQPLWYINVKNSLENTNFGLNFSQFYFSVESAEYNRILYQRMQEEIKNIKQNLSVNGLTKARCSQAGRNKLQINQTNLSSKSQNLWVTLGHLLNFEVPTFSIKPYGDLPKLRSYWAINKTNIFTFKQNNSTSQLWSQLKLKEQSKSNKTKKMILVLMNVFNSKNLKNIYYSKLKNKQKKLNYLSANNLNLEYSQFSNIKSSMQNKNTINFFGNKLNKPIVKHRKHPKRAIHFWWSKNTLNLNFIFNNQFNNNDFWSELGRTNSNMTLNKKNSDLNLNNKNNLILKNKIPVTKSFYNLTKNLNEKRNNNLITVGITSLWACLILVHVCSLFSLLRISEIRGLIKFHVLIFYKLSSSYLTLIYFIYNKIKKYKLLYWNSNILILKNWSHLNSTSKNYERILDLLNQSTNINYLEQKTLKLPILNNSKSNQIHNNSKNLWPSKTLFSKQIWNKNIPIFYSFIPQNSKNDLDLKSSLINLSNINLFKEKKVLHSKFVGSLFLKLNFIPYKFSTSILIGINNKFLRSKKLTDSLLFCLIKIIKLISYLSVKLSIKFKIKTVLRFSNLNKFKIQKLENTNLEKVNVDLQQIGFNKYMKSLILFWFYSITEFSLSIANNCFILLYVLLIKIVDLIESFIRVICEFLEKPGELMLDWIAQVFLIEWSSDILSYVPETVDILVSNSFQKFGRGLRGFGLIGTLFERRLWCLTEIFTEILTTPDTDLIMRQKKGILFWDIWAEILISAADQYNINIASLTTLKEEQDLLLKKLIEDENWDWWNHTLAELTPLIEYVQIVKPQGWLNNDLKSIPKIKLENKNKATLNTLFSGSDNKIKNNKKTNISSKIFLFF